MLKHLFWLAAATCLFAASVEARPVSPYEGTWQQTQRLWGPTGPLQNGAVVNVCFHGDFEPINGSATVETALGTWVGRWLAARDTLITVTKLDGFTDTNVVKRITPIMWEGSWVNVFDETSSPHLMGTVRLVHVSATCTE
jgi:hypothetical protein